MPDSIAPADITPASLALALETLALEDLAPGLLNRLRHALGQAAADPTGDLRHLGRPIARRSQHGSLSLFVPDEPPPHAPLRLATFDRHGRLLLLLTWRGEGSDRTLQRFKVRGLDGRFLGVSAATASHLGWGLSDCLWTLDGEVGFQQQRFLTLFRAVRYTDVAAIPPLDDPGSLPPGAGSSVLNVFALLSQDQGKRALRYRGPYPSERLFGTLREAFHSGGEAGSARERFTRGAQEAALRLEMREAEVDWTPSPYEYFFPAAHTCVQLRKGIEKVYDRGRVYCHPELSVNAHALRTDYTEDGQVYYTASLTLLGQSVEDHLVLSVEGTILARPLPPHRWHVREPSQLSDELKAVFVRLIAAESAPALQPEMWPVVDAMRLSWGTVRGELWEERKTGLVLHAGMVAVYREALAGAQSAGQALLLAARFTSELARLIGPLVRMRAQARLARRSLEDQRVALLFHTPADRGLSNDDLRAVLSRLALGEDLPAVSAED